VTLRSPRVSTRSGHKAPALYSGNIWFELGRQILLKELRFMGFFPHSYQTSLGHTIST